MLFRQVQFQRFWASVTGRQGQLFAVLADQRAGVESGRRKGALAIAKVTGCKMNKNLFVSFTVTVPSAPTVTGPRPIYEPLPPDFNLSPSLPKPSDRRGAKQESDHPDHSRYSPDAEMGSSPTGSAAARQAIY